MWQPEPGWRQLPGGAGTSTVGVWLGPGDTVIKRLARPTDTDPAELSDQRHFAYWRREAEVALSRVLETTPGLTAVPCLDVVEDDEGITLTVGRVVPDAPNGLFIAGALARFTATAYAAPWLARDQLRTRLERTARRGGWPTLARTTVADVAEHLWRRRDVLLGQFDALPQVLQHGDPALANLPAQVEDQVVCLDWATFGSGPVGADLGYFALGAREDFEPLLAAYVEALPPGLATADQVRTGATINAVYTVISRAEWALARVAGGEGALAGKFRHPSVAPYVRSMQRQFPQIEALL